MNIGQINERLNQSIPSLLDFYDYAIDTRDADAVKNLYTIIGNLANQLMIYEEYQQQKRQNEKITSLNRRDILKPIR